MRYKMLVLMSILTLSMLTLLPQIGAYAEHPAPIIDGTITKGGCRAIDGTIITETVDANHTQTIELCKYDSKNFKLVVWGSFCLGAEVDGKDPDTGKIYSFPSNCDLPQPCDSPTSWGAPITAEAYYEELNITIGEKQFNVLTQSVGGLCIVPEFIPEEKKISLTVKGLKDSERSIVVVIPDELLSGEFKIMVDGVSSAFDVSDTDIFGMKRPSNSIITIELDFSKPERKVDIIGTQVIPEFPMLGLIIFASAMSCILVARLVPKLGRRQLH